MATPKYHLTKSPRLDSALETYLTPKYHLTKSPRLDSALEETKISVQALEETEIPKAMELQINSIAKNFGVLY